MSGRRLAPVWIYFHRDSSKTSNIKAICKGCNAVLQGIPKRLEKHVEICKELEQPNVSVLIKREYEGEDAENIVIKRPKIETIETLVVTTTDEEIKVFDLQLTRAIIASNSPFSLVDNPEFIKFYKMIRPGISLAERHSVAGPLLDMVYTQEREKARTKFRGDVVTLAMDGWSNVTNDPVIGVSITSNGATYHVDTIDTTGNAHTTKYMTNVALDAITKAEHMFNVSVGHIVTDGSSNMGSMRQSIQDARGTGIITYHCQPHLLNLLAKDINKEQSVTINKVTTVLKYFTNKHSAQSKLKDYNITKPPLPAETRWNTSRDTLLYYCTNWATLVQIISELQQPNATERTFLENIQVRRAAYDLLAIFEAIIVAQNRLQADTANIAEAVEVWLDLLDQIQCLNNPSAIEMATKRSQEALNHPAFLAANLLDHRYFGKRLTPAQLVSATRFIKELDSDTERAVTLLIAGTTPYDVSLLSDDVDSCTWWTAGRRFGFDESLCNVALKLVSAIANNAGLERQFSSSKFTYGSLRTSLGVEKAGKLAFCYRSLNQG